MSTQELSSLFGWAAVFTPLIMAAVAYAVGASRWTVGSAVILTILGAGAQHFRGAYISELTANRWEPLSANEVQSLQTELRGLPAPKERFQIVCTMAGCSDLAESLRRAFQLGPDWNPRIVSAMWDTETDTGIDLWHHNDVAKRIATAISKSTNGRLPVRLQEFSNTSSDQINLVIGRKP